ncbi:MAG: DNA-directed RNA polymerase subunit omega [Blastocatellia bacterium]|nr:DNA-directed RNA polymerase subunit omega [Blastocatellia bacterium]
MENFSQSADSKFKLINVAAKRCRELRSGARPRLQQVSSRNFAKVALEEVKAGLIKYESLPPPNKKDVDDTEGVPVAL